MAESRAGILVRGLFITDDIGFAPALHKISAVATAISKRETAVSSGMFVSCSALYVQDGTTIGEILSGSFLTILTPSVNAFHTPDATGTPTPHPNPPISKTCQKDFTLPSL